MIAQRRIRLTPLPLLVGPLLGLLAVGCGPSQEMEQRIADLEAAAAQKDSLLVEIADLGRFISDVNAELSDVSLESAEQSVMAESPAQASRDSTLAKIQVLAGRVTESEQRLAESRRRIRALSLESDTLQSLLAETIRSYERTIQSQRENIAALNERIETLEFENVQLAANVEELAATVDTLQSETNTVYYVVGTEDELLERGLVQKEGGARFLFIFGKRGQTIVPARDLDPAAFSAIDRRLTAVIPLPDSTAEYEIVSRHPVEYVSQDILNEDGRIEGDSLTILEPDQFWAPSRFLILVERT